MDSQDNCKPESNFLGTDTQSNKRKPACLYAAYFAEIGFFGNCNNVNCPKCYKKAIAKKMAKVRKKLKKLNCEFGSISVLIRLANKTTLEEIISLKEEINSKFGKFDGDANGLMLIAGHYKPKNKHLHLCFVSKWFDVSNMVGYWAFARAKRKFQPVTKRFDAAWFIDQILNIKRGYIRKIKRGRMKVTDSPIKFAKYCLRDGIDWSERNKEEIVKGIFGNCFRRKRIRERKTGSLKRHFSPWHPDQGTVETLG